MQVALYARVSTHQQHQEHTIDSQVHLLKHYIQQQGWTLLPDHAYLDDGMNGTRLDRPALDRLRDAAQRGEFDKPRHDLRYTRVHFSRPYPVRSNSNSTNCCAEKALRACRWRVCGRYTTKDSWGVSGMSAPCGEAKRVG